MSISKRLKLVCQEKNWKLKDFSEATGLPYRTAQGYLNGTREPNAESLATINYKINVNLNWLLNGNGEIFIPSRIEGINYNESQLLDNYRLIDKESKEIIFLLIEIIHKLNKDKEK